MLTIQIRKMLVTMGLSAAVGLTGCCFARHGDSGCSCEPCCSCDAGGSYDAGPSTMDEEAEEAPAPAPSDEPASADSEEAVQNYEDEAPVRLEPEAIDSADNVTPPPPGEFETATRLFETNDQLFESAEQLFESDEAPPVPAED